MSTADRLAGLGPSPFAEGATVGIGSLPHQDPAAAAAFAIGEFDIATVPTLPQRSAAESMLGQAAAAIDGVHLDADRRLVAERQPSVTGVRALDVGDDALGGVRAFLDLAAKVRLDGAAVKWQFVGPVTLGAELVRAGVDPSLAFEVAAEAVRVNLAALSTVIGDAMPNSRQLVLLDEPSFGGLMDSDFPIAPDHAIDLLSSAMATLPKGTTAGVHCCAPCDVATLLASGPAVVSLPVSADLVDWVGYITRFLDDGGVVAWGVVATDGPVPSVAERPWRTLSDLWCAMVQRGCDPVLLRRQGIVTPSCGLALHAPSVARRIARLSADVGKRVKDQSAATKFALGA